MSAAREVGGVRGTVGRRVESKAQRGWLSKAEQEALRTGFHDFLRVRGERVRPVAKPQFGRGCRGEGEKASGAEAGPDGGLGSEVAGGAKAAGGAADAEVGRVADEGRKADGGAGEVAGGWMERFLRSYLRSGDLRSAAELAGISYGVVRGALARDGEFRERCAEALEEHSWRMLERCARVKGSRWVLSRRTAGALVGYVERRLGRGAGKEAGS